MLTRRSPFSIQATYVADMERTIKLQLRAILRQRKGPRAKTQHDRLKRDFEAVQAMAARRMHRAPQSYAQRHGVPGAARPPVPCADTQFHGLW